MRHGYDVAWISHSSTRHLDLVWQCFPVAFCTRVIPWFMVRLKCLDDNILTTYTVLYGPDTAANGCRVLRLHMQQNLAMPV